ncbi:MULTISPECIES: BMC domain-containing protein [Clostridium]|uniref:BMC domain-containing protein n=1 Tax=Clostridium TaxID=1485 RepID=UPI0004010903|nr:BMC domain-containing protein [Clostridium cadaveris]MDU4953702.1 BMC domain-containing protein [Clostridium sp.]MDY4948135.1 BMC domain-containing protein [Clostridium cadaveris]NME65280.1 BMC domain-containing protein [Clostridium cadaveris]NWK10635.1 BMC domain-containing protein [Clostridium cadaveris]
MKALGMIEVNGYLAAVEAADAALKAANVTLIGIEIVKAGISNVQVVGDVDAVQASVDAGRAAANSLGLLRSSHVIPRPHEELLKIFPNLEKKKEDSPVEKVKDDNDKIHKEDVIAPSKMEKTEDIKQSKDITQEIVKLEKTLENYRNKKEKALKENVKKDENTNYGDMKVETLRNMVRALKLPNMSSKQIKQEKKEELIKILQEYDEKGDK